MKKIFCAVLVLSLLASLPVFAEETSEKGMPEMRGMPGKDCMGMGPKASMVATDEGGVIVLAGNKLIKYDADLNVGKEVEIKAPMGGTMCPMMKAGNETEASTAETSKKVS